MPTKTPDEYREEMMRLYRRAQPAPPPTPQPQPTPMPEPQPQPTPMPRPEPEPAPAPRPEPEPAPMPRPEPQPTPMPGPQPQPAPMPGPQPQPTPMPRPQPQPTPMPEPEPQPTPMPRLEPEPAPIPEPELIPTPVPTPEETSFGWLKVITRTADNAYPIEGVSVLILRQNGMETNLIYSLVTDQSGETQKVQLPAPPISSERMQPFSTYQVQVFSPGYRRLESENVPVFSGITTLQPFAMIPLPANVSDNEPAIIYQNTEPTF